MRTTICDGHFNATAALPNPSVSLTNMKTAIITPTWWGQHSRCAHAQCLPTTPAETTTASPQQDTHFRQHRLRWKRPLGVANRSQCGTGHTPRLLLHKQPEKKAQHEQEKEEDVCRSGNRPHKPEPEIGCQRCPCCAEGGTAGRLTLTHMVELFHSRTVALICMHR